MAVEPAAPWEAVPADEQLFVLITGANSGVGLGTAQRLIDEFLATRSAAAHLVLVLTTRSPAKSRHAVREVRAYAARAALRAAPAVARATGAVRAAAGAAAARVHVLSLQLDLCDLGAVRAFARRLATGPIGIPDGRGGESLRAAGVPRLDSVVFNAAYGGWAGCDYLRAVWSMLTRGLVESVTWPTFKKALPTSTLNERPGYGYPPKPLLGEVFAACVFGHYMLAHELLLLLSRPPSSGLAPGRIIWLSSLEAVADVLAPDDLQCLARPAAYESAKRLTDVLVLTLALPAARPLSSRWLTMDGAGDDHGRDGPPPVAPRVYVTHPGIVASTIFPVPWFLFWAYELALVLSRWLGSPWHTVDAYTGAAAAVWVALQGQDALDAAAAERVKWGSAADRRGRAAVKKTEVDGWGWEGRPEDPDALAADPAVGVLRKARGRRRGVADVTDDDIVRFEELGARCWRDMEALRAAWNDILDDEPDQ